MRFLNRLIGRGTQAERPQGVDSGPGLDPSVGGIEDLDQTDASGPLGTPPEDAVNRSQTPDSVPPPPGDGTVRD